MTKHEILQKLMNRLEALAESWPHDTEVILDSKVEVHFNYCRRCQLERVLKESGLAELLEARQAKGGS